MSLSREQRIADVNFDLRYSSQTEKQCNPTQSRDKKTWIRRRRKVKLQNDCRRTKVTQLRLPKQHNWCGLRKPKTEFILNNKYSMDYFLFEW